MLKEVLNKSSLTQALVSIEYIAFDSTSYDTFILY